jgi:hypothetical protein
VAVGAMQNSERYHTGITRTMSGSISIPSSWNSYTVEIAGKMTGINTDVAGHSIRYRMLFDGSAMIFGTTVQTTFIEAGPASPRSVQIPIFAYAGSRTTTGSRSFQVVISSTGATSWISVEDVVLVAKAYRTS